jgi:DNA repair protein RadA/Sms
MAKVFVHYECQSCAAISPTWQGQCGSCKEWNTLLEQSFKEKGQAKSAKQVAKTQPIQLKEVKQGKEDAYKTGINELDNLLGIGFVKGSVTLLGGEPGIGKSTLSLQLAQKMAGAGRKVLIVSGEESESQIQYRSRRLGENPESLMVYAQTDMEAILLALHNHKPDLVILDSIQVVHHSDVAGVDGSISQVRYCAQKLIQWVKQHESIGIIIGHITKDGHIAGPKVLEHMVDVILYLEGERNQHYRLLRSYKNRYSTTNNVAIFEMKKEGLIEVLQPSELFIDDATLSSPGSVVAPILEGNRVILVEVQALVVKSNFGMSKRNVVGVDAHRATLMIATLEKILGIQLATHDIFLNIIGGLKVKEPGLDLAMVYAIMSSILDKPLGRKVGLIGEVGLTGECRAVPQMKKRLLELEKMGFEACVLPEKSLKGLEDNFNIELIPLSHIRGLHEFARAGFNSTTA